MDNEKLNDGMLEQVDGGARIVYQVQAGETLEAIRRWKPSHKTNTFQSNS